jgi:hypothetical protein
MASTDYKHGEMEVSSQKGTFGGFMTGTVYGGSAIVYILMFPILMFAVRLGWLPSLIASVVVGFVLGLALKLKGGWYVFVVGLAIVTGIFCAILSAVF